nr:immunoglobulin heavy chain junction region [Mus musculus]
CARSATPHSAWFAYW